MRVSLGAAKSGPQQAADFRLAGLYKIQTNGTPIHDGSEVTIGSCMLGDHFLHTSWGQQSDASSEVNLSVEHQAWNLHLYHEFTPDDCDYLMLRQPILLFQTEAELFVRGSDGAGSDGNALKLHDDATNLKTSFEFESTNEEHFEGGMLRWRTEYRLRNVASKRYVAKSHPQLGKADCYEFVLVDDASKGSLFQVYPSNLVGDADDGEFVSINATRTSGCRIACVDNSDQQYWFHNGELETGGGDVVLRNVDQCDVLRTLPADVLRILPANGDDTPDIVYTLSCVRGAMCYVRMAGAAAAAAEAAAAEAEAAAVGRGVVVVTGEAASSGGRDLFVSKEARDFRLVLQSILVKLGQKSRVRRIQNIFRSLKLIDALMWALQIPFLTGESIDDALPHMAQTMQLGVTKALKAIIANNVENQFFFARKDYSGCWFFPALSGEDVRERLLCVVGSAGSWVEGLLHQLKWDVGAHDVLHYMVTDNLKVVREHIAQYVLRDILETMHSIGHPKAAWLDFFAKLCVCNGLGIPQQQELCLRLVFSVPSSRDRQGGAFEEGSSHRRARMVMETIQDHSNQPSLRRLYAPRTDVAGLEEVLAGDVNALRQVKSVAVPKEYAESQPYFNALSHETRDGFVRFKCNVRDNNCSVSADVLLTAVHSDRSFSPTPTHFSQHIF
jgi:hypothetical protein